MPKVIKIEPHLSFEELEAGYRQAKEPVKRTHYQIIWLLAKGMSTQEVAAVTSYSQSWIYELVWGYNRSGVKTLGDQRLLNQGSSKPLLDDVQQALLWQALQEPPAQGGQWNGRKVAEWIADLVGRPVSRQRGWEYLKQMRFRLRVPRPEHTESSLEEQADWKKNLQTKVEQIQTQNPESDVEVWAQDEHRVGLKPVIRRIWVDEWTVPTANVNWCFKWLWLYAFVHPNSGQTYWWILPYVNIQLFNNVLADFAQHFGIGENKQVVLVVDQAGWHSSTKVKIPQGIHLEFLPSHSPELQPAERLWTLTNEPIANRSFESLDEVEEILSQRCRQIIDQPDFVHGLTNFHWWPELAA